MCAEQLQGKVLPSDQIAPHGVSEICPPELIAAYPVNHFLAVSGRAIYNAKWDLQTVKDGIPIIIHQQTLTPDIDWFSTAKLADTIFHASDRAFFEWLYQLLVLHPNLQGV